MKRFFFAFLLFTYIFSVERACCENHPKYLLTLEEVRYLKEHGPIVFVSQSQYPPFEAVQKDGALDGMSIELVRWLATELGFKAEFRHMSFQEAQQAVLDSKADVLTSLFYSEKRAERFAFSESIFDVPASIFVKADRPDISRLDDLRGKRIAIQRGDYAKEYLESNGISFELLPTENFAQAMDAVIAGRTDALIGDEQIVLHHLYSHNLTSQAKKVGPPLYVGKNCLAIRKGDELLIGIITKGVVHARERKVLDGISAKWLGAAFPEPDRGVARFAPQLAAGVVSLLAVLLIVAAISLRLRSLVRAKTREHWAVLDASLAGISMVRDRMIIWANPAMYAIFGYGHRELESMPTLELYSSREAYERLGAEVYPALERGEAYQTETEMRRKDGSLIWVHMQGKAIDQATPLAGSVWTFDDVTARKRAEKELQESEEQYRFLLESANDAIMIHSVSTDGKPGPFFLVNELACKWFGYTREEFARMTPFELNEPQHLSHVPEVMARLRQEGRAVFETVMVCKNASRIPVEISTRLLQIKDCPYILSLLRDISQREAVQRALSENEANFRSFFETMDDIIWVCSTDGKVIDTNTAASRILGYSREELQNMTVLEAHPADRRTEAQAIFSEMLTGKRAECPLPLAQKNGQLVPVETRIWFGRWHGEDCVFGISKNLTVEMEAKQRFERLFRNNPAPMAVSSMPERNFIDVNDAFLSVTGYAREEVLGRTSQELYLFPDAALQNEIAAELHAHGSISNYEIQLQCKGGSLRYGIFSGEVIFSQGREYFLTVMIDITERKRAEDALQELEKSYSDLIKYAPIGIFTSTIDGRFLSVNSMLAHIYGYPSARDLVDSIVDIEAQLYVDPGERETIKGILADKGMLRRDVRRRRKDGSIIWVSLFMRVVKDTSETVRHYEGFVADINDRKLAEQALRRSERKFRAFFESPESIKLIIAPESWELLDANKAAVDFYGYSHEQMCGKTFIDLDTATREEIFQRFNKLFGTRIEHYFSQHRTANGEYRDVEIYASFISHEGKQAVNAIIHDVTELRRLEKIKDDVERLVRHDLRSPLVGLVNFPQLLLEAGNLTSEQRKMIGLMASAAGKMLNMINSSLKMYQIESGHYELITKRCHPMRIVNVNADILTAGTFSSSGQVQIQAYGIPEPAEDFTIMTDCMLLDIVVMNLLNNALQASHSDVLVKVVLTLKEGELAVSFWNSRPVPVEIRACFFEKYTTAGKIGGTGLGTYSAAIMTRAMGGKIEMSTSDEEGTTVTVRLPLF